MSCLKCSCNIYTQINGAQLKQRVSLLTAFSGLMVVGESPTTVECKAGNLMSGAGAQVLKDTFQKIGLPYKDSEVYYTTAIKCAVPKKKGQKFPSDAPLNCREYLLKEIRAVKPKMILVCGATALATLTGNSTLKVTEMYGRVMDTTIEGAQVLPIMNPGVLIHKPGDYKPFLSYLQLAATIFNGATEKDTGETKYIVCDTREKCVTLWKTMQAGSFTHVSYDMETTGLDYRTAEFLVLGICFEKNLVYVIPREMRGFVHNFLEGVPWKCIWQHGMYDKKVLWRRELGNASIDEDTIYMHYVLDETSAHDLGYLTKVYLNAKEYKYKMNQEWKSVSLETYNDYFDALCERVAVDADYTLQLYHVFIKELQKEENAPLLKVYRELLIRGANFLSRVAQNGILVNPKYLDMLDVKYQALLQEISDNIAAMAVRLWDKELYIKQTGAKSAPLVFNPGSPQQMAWLIFDRLKLHPRIKKGRSTDKDILGSIEDPPAIVTEVLRYRTVQKEWSTYVIGILKAIDEDGRVRTNFTLHVTATGRLSSKEPNVQNLPASHGVGDIRKAFIARPGYILAEIDYSGAELRWLAFLSRCPVLTEVFINNRNLHKETATALYGPHFTAAEKMIAKALNFGIAYGREANSIKDTFNISIEEAQRMIDLWLDTYYGARDYLRWCADQVTLGKYLETPWGRRRRFGLVSQASLHNLQNEAKNFPIQSASSDTLLEVCMDEEEPLLKQWDTYLLNLIHDSTLMEIPADPKIIKQVATYMDAAMVAKPKDKFNCNIPFKTDFEIGVNWCDAGGVSFDYNAEDPYGEVVHIEEHDGSMTHMTFNDWYVMAMSKEDRYGK